MNRVACDKVHQIYHRLNTFFKSLGFFYKLICALLVIRIFFEPITSTNSYRVNSYIHGLVENSRHARSQVKKFQDLPACPDLIGLP
jgi:hypothetical protein